MTVEEKEPTLKTEINSRGFEAVEEIMIPEHECSIQAYESSSVRPHIWVQSLSYAKDQETDVMVHLSLEKAYQLKNSIHYYIATDMSEREYQVTEEIVNKQYECSIQVSESESHIVIESKSTLGLSENEQEKKVTVPLSIKQAEQLRDSIGYLLENHYSYELYGRPKD